MSTSDTTNTHGTPPFDSPTLHPADLDSADELGWSDASSLASLNGYDSVDESNDSPGTAAPEDRQAYPPDPNEASDQAVCRICLESASSGAAGESLGRLLSPCKCKGTMKYVHASCLDTWRAASLRSSSAVACDQCGAPYRFRKSKFIGIATSPTLLFLVSLFLFLMLIWTVGAAATLVMDLYDKPATIAKTEKRGWWPWRSDDDPTISPVETDAWSYLDADYATPGLWSYSNLIYEPAAYIKLVKDAVHAFASGEAADAVREVVGLQDQPEQAQPADETPQQGFWSALKSEWMHGDGGLWPSKSTSLQPDASQSNAPPDTPASETRKRQKYDARAASDINGSKRRRHKSRSPNASSTPGNGWLSKLFVQFSVGFSLVGILSFLNLVVLAPINLHNFGLGRSFARMTSRGRGGAGGRNANQDGVNIASVLIVLLVVIGVVRALHVVYRLVKKVARRGLSRLEEVIVDWNHEDELAHN
ncbi:hypothetical protein PaG_01800 [Moesziomyces aphidis]|uniref:RING-CH-type domain-containing protein n=1 Tax=Moesziomyces aphidis TaxID=84754 RepID=W3VPM6_MOEAP|nr:hypothetical protein PaG_01800 [Moesziomyces aphidis]